MPRHARSVLLATFVATAVAAILIACASRQSPPAAPPVPDASTWSWYDPHTGVYTWYAPDSGYTWATPNGVPSDASFVPTPGHLMGGAVPTGWAWVNAFVDNLYGSAGTGKGHIYNIHCVLQTQAAADAAVPLYAMCFDTASASQPAPSTAPLAGCVSGALSSTGTDVTYSDQGYTHGTGITFTNGLLIAISGTADTFSAPAAGNQVRCDTLIGN